MDAEKGPSCILLKEPQYCVNRAWCSVERALYDIKVAR